MTKRSRALRTSVGALAAAAAMVVAAACGAEEGPGVDGAVQVVATFSIVADIAEAIGGDAIEVHSMVPIGTDPHEYTPLPRDIAKTTDANLVVWNGLNMEMGDGWFESLLDISGKDIDSEGVVEASVGVDPKYLTASGGTQSQVNPHAFLDPQVGMVFAENIRDGLIAVDPDRSEIYTQNTEAYLAELTEIDQQYVELVGEIPEENRVLVTSENAYQYMADRYGLDTGYIWAIDTEEQGSPEQINSLVKLVKDRQVPSLFVESNVDTRPMETVSRETGSPIFGTIYSDELGAGSYLAMLRHNITSIHDGLAGD